MTREIKFRAWDKDKKEMFAVQNLNCFLLNSPSKYADGSGVPENFGLMQYTGLKDKNGKEIYEGDIVKYKTDKPDKVVYDTACFQLGRQVEYHRNLSMGKLADGMEIIGNIYENPELIEDK